MSKSVVVRPCKACRIRRPGLIHRYIINRMRFHRFNLGEAYRVEYGDIVKQGKQHPTKLHSRAFVERYGLIDSWPFEITN